MKDREDLSKRKCMSYSYEAKLKSLKMPVFSNLVYTFGGSNLVENINAIFADTSTGCPQG